MYRIHFDPNVSKFVVQFLVWGTFWKTCMVHREDMDGPHSTKLIKLFDTYADAAKWVSDKALQHRLTHGIPMLVARHPGRQK